MIRLGFSGGGYWGSNLVRAALKIPDVRVVAIADPDASARNRIASLVKGDIKTHSCFETMLFDPIDAIVIATPPALHVDQAVTALKSNKSVFLEKPPAMNIPDLERLLNAVHGKTLSCDYVYCHNPLIQAAKELMKELGFVSVMSDLRWTNWGIVRHDVDAWWSAGPHPISILCYLFGQIELDWCKRGDGWARAHLGNASVFVTWHHPIKRREVELIGVNHSIFIDDAAKRLWVMRHDREWVPDPQVKYGEPLVNALTDFVSCIKSGEEPITGPKMIERVTRVMCSVE